MGQGQCQAQDPLAEDPAPIGSHSPPAAWGAVRYEGKQGLPGSPGHCPQADQRADTCRKGFLVGFAGLEFAIVSQ